MKQKYYAFFYRNPLINEFAHTFKKPARVLESFEVVLVISCDVIIASATRKRRYIEI